VGAGKGGLNLGAELFTLSTFQPFFLLLRLARVLKASVCMGFSDFCSGYY
jgi:hypothetical protein